MFISPPEPSPGFVSLVIRLLSSPPSPPVAEQCVPKDDVPPALPLAPVLAPPAPPAPIVTETVEIEVTSIYFIDAPPPAPPRLLLLVSVPPPPPPPPTTVTFIV